MGPRSLWRYAFPRLWLVTDYIVTFILVGGYQP